MRGGIYAEKGGGSMDITIDIDVVEMARFTLWFIRKAAPFFGTGPPKLKARFNCVAKKL
jgi:hypothetical protein